MNTQFQAPVDLQEESFRNEVGTMDKTEKENGLSPQAKRKIYKLQGLYQLCSARYIFILPFLKINNNPFFLFNILDRHFYFRTALLSPGFLYPSYRSSNIRNLRNAFQYCIWSDFLWLALPANHLYGDDFPKNRVLD